MSAINESHAQYLKVVNRRLAKVPNLRTVEMSECCLTCRSFSPGDDDYDPACSKFQVPVQPENLCDKYERDR